MFAVHGVPKLDDHLTNMRPPKIVEWLKSGFRAIEQHDPQRLVDSFSPLLINPVRDPLAQLGTAFREAEATGLNCTSRVRRIIRVHLTEAKSIRNESAMSLKRLWQLLGAMACDADLHSTARFFMMNVREARGARAPAPVLSDGVLAEIVEAMMMAVASSTPLTPGQLSFFNFMRTKADFWSSRFVSLVIDSEFMVAREAGEGRESLQETWCDLRERHAADLRVEADPAKPAGRALLRSIARGLGLNPGAAGGAAGALVLRDRLWAIREPAPPLPDPGRGGYLRVPPSALLELGFAT